jgi:putative flavoprotein involved in K+ transport
VTLRQFARQGMILLGHLQAIEGKQITLAPDLEENLAKSEASTKQIMQMIDGYIARTGTEAPQPEVSGEPASNEPISTKSILTLDLASSGINTIIWATGYKLDFDWVRIPVLDQTSQPVHQRGITAFPGLYFLGLHWLYKTKSALLSGIGEDASFIASAITSRD